MEACNNLSMKHINISSILIYMGYKNELNYVIFRIFLKMCIFVKIFLQFENCELTKPIS